LEYAVKLRGIVYFILDIIMNKTSENNKIIIIISVIINFFKSIFLSVFLFIKHLFGFKTWPIKENKFLDILNFLFHIWPKNFWKNPTWIKIGRSIATFIHYIFYKETNFKEKNNSLQNKIKT